MSRTVNGAINCFKRCFRRHPVVNEILLQSIDCLTVLFKLSTGRMLPTRINRF